MATKPRILIVDSSTALVTALTTALTGHAEVVVADDLAPMAPRHPEPVDVNAVFELREPRHAYSSYGPPPRGRKGKTLRWRAADATNPPRGSRGRIT